MSDEPRATKPWDTKLFTLNGAMLGFILGIVHAYVHAFWSRPHEEHLIGHIFWSIALYILVGAALLTSITVIRNWLRREQ
jgi:uncharacterized membrane protein YagU involved in acid resistance